MVEFDDEDFEHEKDCSCETCFIAKCEHADYLYDLERESEDE